ncbi:MAG TPA: ATP-binding protein [Candidatus Binataceae bacterium]|nr:ATP-binding protein [Candidatus Binataceae bacterium]
MAGAFVRVTIDKIDEELNRWLERIVLALGLDRSTIAEINPSNGWATFSHGWAREPERIIGRSLDANTLMPWAKAKMLAGDTIVMASLDALPDEAAIDRETMRRYGPKSNVMIPIKVGGVVVAAVAFGALYHERPWPPQIVRRLQTVAEIFGFALERKRAVTEMLQLRSQLTYIARVNTMGELAASLAHEINQPLAAIRSNAEAIQSMLEAERPDLDEIKAAVADIVSDDARAGDTIRRLRALFRREELVRTEIDLGELLVEVSRIIRSDALIRKVSLTLDLRQPLRAILADRIQIQQAIINLLLNAFDAVAETEETSRQVTLTVLAEDSGCVRLLVRDSGRGIEPDALPRIFDAFFTTKPGGMGMGLAISRSIVEAHGGRLGVSSNPGRGTTFEITLPCPS